MLQKVEMAGKWPTNANTTPFFLIPKSVTSERPIALLPTLVSWWEWLRHPSAVEWKSRFSITWDACSKYVGGAYRAGWESLFGMESMDLNCWQQSKRAATLVVDRAKDFKKSAIKCCLALGDLFLVFTKGIKGTMWIFFAREKGYV